MSEWGIPYMGSKAGIVASIAMNFPRADHFYDLFGGGFSVSHYMLAKRKDRYSFFHYNEIKADVVDLVKMAISGEFNYKRFKPEWISREEFFKRKDTDAYVRCLWSFGNNQKGYLFGQEIEQYKKSMHNAVVFDEFDSLAEGVLGFSSWPKEASSIYKKRMYLRQKIEFYRVNNRYPKTILPYLPSKQLQRLEQLKQLKQLQQLERLSMTSKDYREVEILPSSVVYCDIPYQGTADYGNFSHKDFFDWAVSRPFPVYVSEYKIDDPRFKIVYEISKRSMMSKEKDKCVDKNERLYWNGVVL